MSSPSSSAATTTDVHVLVAPTSLWQAELRCAYSSVCSQSVSAGFARVSPGLSLLDLRSALSQQLDPEVLPHKYVFLRNVGRHMALVSAWQEERFKVAIFAPPFTASSEIYLIDAHCVDMRAAHSSLSSTSSSSLLPRPLPARPRAYSLSPLAPRQPLMHSPPTQLLHSSPGKPAAGGARRRAATLDSSELMQHVSAALNHIAEESPGRGTLEEGAHPSDTACATIACSSQESSTVGWRGGMVIGPADQRRRVIENMSQNVQTVVCDSLANDVTSPCLQSRSVDTSLTSSWVDSEQGGASSNVSQVSTTDWGNVKRSLTATPALLANTPGHHVTPAVEPVRCDVRPDGEGASCEEELAQSEEEEEGQSHNSSVISTPLEPRQGCVTLQSTYMYGSPSHALECGQRYLDGSLAVVYQNDGKRGVARLEEGGGVVPRLEEGGGGVACLEEGDGVVDRLEERGRVVDRLEEGGGGVARLEEGGGGVARLEEGGGGVARLEEGGGGVARLEEGGGGVARLEEGGGGVARLEEGGRGVARLEERGGGVARLEEGGGGVARLEEGGGGVARLEVGGGSLIRQEEPSTCPQLVIRDSAESLVLPPSTQCACEPSFPLSPPLPPIGAQWHQTQTSSANTTGPTCFARSGEQSTTTSHPGGGTTPHPRTVPPQAACTKEQKWKVLFLNEQKRAASLLAREQQLEQEQVLLAQGRSAKVPAPGRSVRNPPSQLSNVRLQLTKMEELEDLKQRVQLTKIDLAREQQDRRQVGSDSKALRKELLGKTLSKGKGQGQ